MFGPLRLRRRKWSGIPIPGFTRAQCRFGLCLGDFIVPATPQLIRPWSPCQVLTRFPDWSAWSLREGHRRPILR